ncbi:MAG TPA: cysteine synthase A [Candidatus Avanaerovorax faecigallinarum]|nr:cysteine synthase A [Candidatus Avanaerovorax faecigallinarum]
MIYNDITETIGRTPLLRLNGIERKRNLKAELYAKLEAFNPAGSIKDRAAYYMIKDAEERGILKPGGTIIEPTSGNTGIGLAAIAAAKGYRAIFVLPESMSVERRKLLKAYGAELVLTDAALGMQGAVDKADELAKEIDGAMVMGQFENPANARAHMKTTGPEIWEALDGKVDMIVAGVGTGGTITGTGKFLKGKNPAVRVIGVEPYDSPLISEGRAGAHKLQGIGANFIPELLDKSVIDDMSLITTEEAYSGVRALATEEGYLAGITSGAALAAALKEAGKPENEGRKIVVILPDTGERYLSTDLFE